MVRSKLWICAAMAAGAAATAAATFPTAANAQQPPTPPPPAAPTSAAVAQPEAVFSDPNAPQDQRDEAAHRIVARRTPESRTFIVAALANISRPDDQLAMARALAENPGLDPDAAFIDPLFALLTSPSSRVAQSAGRALGAYRFRPEVLNRLINTALSRRAMGERLAAIDALGSMVDKSAASTLVQLLTREDDPDSVHNRAADALGALTGLRDENGRDVQRWLRWWSGNANGSDADFRAEILTARAARLDALQQKYDTLADEASNELRNQYLAAPPAARADMLLRMLASPAADARIVGVLSLRTDKDEGRPVPPDATLRLRRMIGDSDPSVRLQVANALQRTNDKDAFEALSHQLAQETNPTVRSAQTRAIGPIGELRAAPQLVALLRDESIIVAKAAADALRDLGQKLHDGAPEQARQAAQALRMLL